jgi:hypothetical protein
MVIVAICAFFASILAFLVGLIPNMKIDFAPSDVDSLYSVISYVGAFVPTTQLGIIVGLVFLVYSIEFLWLLLNWIIAKIPFIE